jgi:hypothetical protein
MRRWALTVALASVLGAVPQAAGGRSALPEPPLNPLLVAQPAGPFLQDSMGPIRDVTARWRSYQPAAAFCIRPDVPEYTPGGVGATATGHNKLCRHSGFRRNAKGLVVIRLRTPPLCPGCRRLFVDFSRIPKANAPPAYYARGHSFYRLASDNFTYTVDPVAHSPNTKNFTNDKLIAPGGSAQEQIVGALDLHQFFGYVTDTAHFVHTAIQGPYYIGPWYLSRRGRRIHGIYLDVDVADAMRNPSPQANAIGYVAGFNSGQVCRGDDDSFYGGCVDWWGFSVSTVDPYAKPR